MGSDDEYVVDGIRVFDELDELDDETKARIHHARGVVAFANSDAN